MPAEGTWLNVTQTFGNANWVGPVPEVGVSVGVWLGVADEVGVVVDVGVRDAVWVGVGVGVLEGV